MNWTRSWGFSVFGAGESENCGAHGMKNLDFGGFLWVARHNWHPCAFGCVSPALG